MGGDAVVSIIHHCHWRDLPVESCDLLCVDAPYSERTHAGHDDGAATAARAAWAASAGTPKRPTKKDNRKSDKAYCSTATSYRKALDYAAWTEEDVDAFVAHWVARTEGWFLSITDHVLAPAWARSLEARGRYVFSPLACVEPGSRVRMVGDGPSQWSCWLVAARPRSSKHSRWGALPGAYVLPPGARDAERKAVIGGKPLWLMERLVEDYSRPGDLVVDPCCGAATTGVAALRHGRRFIGGDAMAEHVALAREAIAAELELSTVSARKAGQVPLFGEVANV